jgi:hypothetical protein
LKIGSYEALWDNKENIWFSSLSKMFSESKQLIPQEDAKKYYIEVMRRVEKAKLDRFGAHIKGAFNY